MCDLKSYNMDGRVVVECLRNLYASFKIVSIERRSHMTVDRVEKENPFYDDIMGLSVNEGMELSGQTDTSTK